MLFLLLGLAVYLAVPSLALGWIQTPFIGAFIEVDMLFSDVGPSGATPWPAYDQGLQVDASRDPAYYQLQAVDGRPVRSAQELQALLEGYQIGDTVTLQTRTDTGALQEFSVPLVKFDFSDQFAYFYIPYLVGLVYLAAGVWVFAVRRQHVSGCTFAMFSASIAIIIGLIFDVLTTQRLLGFWTLALALTGGLAVALALFFPRPDPSIQRRPWVLLIVMLASLALAGFSLLRLQNPDGPLSHRYVWTLEFGVLALGIVFFLAWSLVRRTRGTPIDRAQVHMTGLAMLFSFTPLGVWAIFQWLASVGRLPRTGFSPLLLLFLGIFPVLTGYAVQRYRLLQADLVLSLGVRYGLLSVIVSVGYALIVSGLGLAAGTLFSPDNPILTGLIFFALALLLNPLRQFTQRTVDSIFFRNKRAYQDRLQTLSGELTRVMDLPGILRILRRYVQESLSPTRLHIFIYDSLNDQYAATADESGQTTSDLRFPVGGGLAVRLMQQHMPLLLSETDPLPGALDSDRTRLTLLGAQAFVALPGRQRLSGWLAFSQRLSGEPYSSMQLSFVEALCEQAALAIERAQVVANMENRVREMNMLTRVAQGINITLSLDDILELVYAQTSQILPSASFHIMLHREDLDQYEYAFYLEGDDRISSWEGHPMAVELALDSEVIRLRRSLLTDDYNRECMKRGILPQRKDLFAWMGVPLNAGATTIGALCLGSADPAVLYTPEQLALLQAIADQVAGALVKARLLLETERRARQLTTLNEVTRQLTSTLEIEPLLQSILQSAVEILNCEAGSLLLMEDATDELVFRSVVGPVAETLINRRMPAGRGVVGKSAKTKEAIIVNDVSRFPEWFSKPDKDTGFITRAVLVIPLIVKERVIGVIEVINKRDGTSFSRDDQELLAAFASQAAVAMENARLYTNTDQALAARVEELSVMQRIDRELNTSLDATRAMRITLEWALRQSGAAAGLVGVVQQGEEGDFIRIVAHEGCDGSLQALQTGVLPASSADLQQVLRGGLPVSHAAVDGWKPELLPGGQSQTIVPIHREANTIGVLMLESPQPQLLSDETMNFLIRLSDHASIAISNAQLYAEVQQANLAKSDFVSFVAHELKNPMTSVKGYTELIAAGAVGPVNDAQANFLSTIRSNIDRMNTLVSDLNDMSKIEVGRLRLDFKSLRLADSVDTAVKSIRKQIEEKQQTLTIGIPADLTPVWADRTRLEQVLVNLISNAYKYTLAGGAIEIVAERSRNTWDPNGAPEVVHIWVRDNGIGIAEEDQKKIFQKFFRSDDPKTREVTGTGLGLNITRSLVEMQGGRIWFESTFRTGTIFHFTVPVSENE